MRSDTILVVTVGSRHPPASASTSSPPTVTGMGFVTVCREPVTKVRPFSKLTLEPVTFRFKVPMISGLVPNVRGVVRIELLLEGGIVPVGVITVDVCLPADNTGTCAKTCWSLEPRTSEDVLHPLVPGLGEENLLKPAGGVCCLPHIVVMLWEIDTTVSGSIFAHLELEK